MCSSFRSSLSLTVTLNCNSQVMHTEKKLNVRAAIVFQLFFQFLISEVLTAPHYVLSNLLGIVADLQDRASVGLRMYVHYITARSLRYICSHF